RPVQRTRLGVLTPQRHQTRHLMLGEPDLLATELRQAQIGHGELDAVALLQPAAGVGSGGHGVLTPPRTAGAGGHVTGVRSMVATRTAVRNRMRPALLVA